MSKVRMGPPREARLQTFTVDDPEIPQHEGWTRPLIIQHELEDPILIGIQDSHGSSVRIQHQAVSVESSDGVIVLTGVTYYNGWKFTLLG